MGMALGVYGRDMTAVAHRTDPVIGRDDEIDRVVCILRRRSKKNALLVGAPGVGKTAPAVAPGAHEEGDPVQCIGATTYDAYTRFIDKDAALERRFQKVQVDEPTTDATIDILLGLKQRYEAHHGLIILNSTIVAAVRLAARYIPGSTGVGKTELAKALAEQLFDSDKMLIRFDMSEFVGPGSVSRLIGAPPRKSGGIHIVSSLFDEVEKEDPSVFNAFLQLLDDGMLTDGKGRQVDFKNTLVIMTSNLGAEHLAEGMTSEEKTKVAHDLVMKQVQKHFRPEFLNRLSDVVIFKPLARDKLKEVAQIQMKSTIAGMADKGIFLCFSDAALDIIFSESYSPMYGARPIRRWLQKNVITKVAEMLIKGEVDEGSTISIDVTDDKKSLKYEVTKKMTMKQDEMHVMEIASRYDDEVEDVAPIIELPKDYAGGAVPHSGTGIEARQVAVMGVTADLSLVSSVCPRRSKELPHG
ncbi:hypothetical protein PR202_ga06210 [Eleusine coracana subsp. coracana]|uniref:Clp ATPase C-terminal domain-containing protein n=1 Tax=Eleusine coracana subsp. coracana TaxID=191504 RepID=A0AAV5BVJ8_ELECO|nr:hypothetical protein PR202_ga06210 [Eleusine coracana subsp. coracana]